MRDPYVPSEREIAMVLVCYREQPLWHAKQVEWYTGIRCSRVLGATRELQRRGVLGWSIAATRWMVAS